MKFIIFFLLLFSFYGFAQECTIKANVISAQYDILSKGSFKEGDLENRSSSTLFEFHRKGNRVLQEFSQTGFSNVWTRGAHERISLLRAFEKYQHAIEYQPNELSHKPNWQRVYQPVPVPNVTEMELVSQTGKGCELTQQFRMKSNNSEYQVTWLPKLELVSYFQIKNDMINKEWRLKSYQINSERSELLFTRYANFSSTDYADIGDNESIPFLAKMINQGFSSTQVANRQQHSHQH